MPQNIFRCPKCGATIATMPGGEIRYCSSCGTPVVVPADNQPLSNKLEKRILMLMAENNNIDTYSNNRQKIAEVFDEAFKIAPDSPSLTLMYLAFHNQCLFWTNHIDTTMNHIPGISGFYTISAFLCPQEGMRRYSVEEYRSLPSGNCVLPYIVDKPEWICRFMNLINLLSIDHLECCVKDFLYMFFQNAAEYGRYIVDPYAEMVYLEDYFDYFIPIVKNGIDDVTKRNMLEKSSWQVLGSTRFFRKADLEVEKIIPIGVALPSMKEYISQQEWEGICKTQQ